MNTHVKEAGFGKRLIAYVIDAVIVIILTVLLYNYVTSTYLYNALGGNTAGQAMYQYATDSELMRPTYGADGKTITAINVYQYTDTVGQSSTPADQSKPGYEEYYKRAWFYYTSFIYSDSQATGRSVAMTNTSTIGGTTTFTQDDYYTYFEQAVMLLPDPSKITDVTVEANLTSDKSPYFKYALNDAGTAVDIHKMPVLRSNVQALVDANTATTLTSLNTYMYDSTNANGYGLYGTAVVDLTGGNSSHSSVQTYYLQLYSEQNKDIWISAFVAYVPFQLIFFLIIPLIRKKGETIGKLAMGISVVKIDGFNVTWKEKLIRQFMVTTLGMLVILPWVYIGVMLYILFAVIDYMVLVMSKTHQSLHDRLAKTEAVARKESLFFDDEAALAAYAATHPEQFPELANPQTDAETSRIAQEDSILDLSTLNKNRDEAAKMTSFDDYEKKKDEENASKTPFDQPKVNLTKEDDAPAVGDEQAMKDLAALEGGVPDEKGEVKDEDPTPADPKK
jgi:uncharacterized RDD family membrane protein YckC